MSSSNSGRKTYWESVSQMAPSWKVCKGNFQCVKFFFLCQLSNLFPAFPSHHFTPWQASYAESKGRSPTCSPQCKPGDTPVQTWTEKAGQFRQQASHQLQAEQKLEAEEQKKVQTATRKQALVRVETGSGAEFCIGHRE